MNRNQAEALLKSTFEYPFNENKYAQFVKELINKLEKKEFDYYGQYIKKAFREDVKRFKRIGTYTDPNEEQIDILIVEFKRETSLNRARSLQRNFISDYLKNRGEKNAALVAYFSEDSGTWRFSFVKMEYELAFTDKGIKAKEKITPAKRFSFLVGNGEPNHTAQQQLVGLLQEVNKNPSLADLEEAFDIESITQEFFNKYKDLFLELKEEMDDILAKSLQAKREFKNKEIETSNFAKKLLGQIVFLYFIQKKGWLGVPEKGKFGNGPKDFLREQFEAGKYENYFNDILEPLFYDALATERTGHWYEPLKCRIPFLNGGLFEPLNGYDWKNIDLPISNELFKDIFEIFGLYNFTVQEDEPLDKEVAVDPEMLGKVFENLLDIQDRKSKGAFYTPREIVHYMCQESLINYLDTRLNQREENDKSSPMQQNTKHNHSLDIPKDEIETFIHYGEFTVENDEVTEDSPSYNFQMPGKVRENANLIDEVLRDVKVCDPAIGSGAFLVGMMKEVVKARISLTPHIQTSSKRDAYKFKWECIEKSLYGVDIDSGAVEIAKLRLWLSLVVDEENYKDIRPLPNLDYKIICGSSLQKIDQIDKFLNFNKFTDLENKKYLYFNTTSRRNKQVLRSEINTLLNELTNDLSVFDYEVYFSEIFSSQGGFDIAVANPPYIRQERLKEIKPELKKNFPSVYTGTADLYVYFFAMAISILRKAGVMTYITPNKFMRANYGKKLRGFLVRETSIHTLINFEDLHIFDATTYPMISIATNISNPENEVAALEIRSLGLINRLSQEVTNTKPMKQQNLSEDCWQIVPVEIRKLLTKLKSSGESLEKYVDGKIFYGIKTGLNEAFVIDEKTRNRLIEEDPKSEEIIKPYLIGKNINKWNNNSHQNLYLISIPSSQNISYAWSNSPTNNKAENIFSKEYPSIFFHLMKYKDKLIKRYDQGKFYWELRSCAYWKFFQDQCITWGNLSITPKFSLTDKGTIVNAPANIIVIDTKRRFYLLGILNSNICDIYIKLTGATRQGGFIEYKPMYVSKIPIPDCPEELKIEIDSKVKLCIKAAKDNAESLGYLENELNQLVYKAYQLNEEEIQTVKNIIR